MGRKIVQSQSEEYAAGPKKFGELCTTGLALDPIAHVEMMMVGKRT